MRRSYRGYIDEFYSSHFDYINSLANVSINKKTKNELYRSNKKEIKRVIFNEPYTIVIWANGEKTIVKAQDGEPYDKEKGLAMCFAKYFLGNTCRYFDFFKEVCDEAELEDVSESKPGILYVELEDVSESNPGILKEENNG